MYRNVNIGRDIDGNELEKVLIKSAEEIGLKAVSKDKSRIEYNLGSIQEQEVYTGTTIRLNKGIIPFAEITRINKKEGRGWLNSSFSIWNGIFCFPYGFGTKKQIERYLSKVSENLNPSGSVA